MGALSLAALAVYGRNELFWRLEFRYYGLTIIYVAFYALAGAFAVWLAPYVRWKLAVMLVLSGSFAFAAANEALAFVGITFHPHASNAILASSTLRDPIRYALDALGAAGSVVGFVALVFPRVHRDYPFIPPADRVDPPTL